MVRDKRYKSLWALSLVSGFDGKLLWDSKYVQSQNMLHYKWIAFN